MDRLGESSFQTGRNDEVHRDVTKIDEVMSLLVGGGGWGVGGRYRLAGGCLSTKPDPIGLSSTTGCRTRS